MPTLALLLCLLLPESQRGIAFIVLTFGVMVLVGVTVVWQCIAAAI